MLAASHVLSSRLHALTSLEFVGRCSSCPHFKVENELWHQHSLVFNGVSHYL